MSEPIDDGEGFSPLYMGIAVTFCSIVTLVILGFGSSGWGTVIAIGLAGSGWCATAAVWRGWSRTGGGLFVVQGLALLALGLLGFVWFFLIFGIVAMVLGAASFGASPE